MMDNEQIKQFLYTTDLFKRLSNPKIEKISSKTEVIELLTGDVLIEADEFQNHLFFLVHGELEAVKVDVLVDKTHLLNQFHDGDTIGEISIIDEEPASAIVRATRPSQCLKLHKDTITQLDDPSVYAALARTVTARLRETNNKVVKSLRQELAQSKQLAALGQFITYVLLLLSAYNITLQAFMGLVNNKYTQLFASTTVILMFTIGLAILIKRSGYHYRDYGLTMAHAGRSLKEALFFTMIAILIITGIKFLVLASIGSNKPFLDIKSAIPAAEFGTRQYFLMLFAGMGVYALFVPLQEFISRGVVQSSLNLLLTGTHADFWAIIITSALFSAMHVHISTKMALVVFIPSCFWGWLYMRNKTLIGPIVSHIIIGWFAIFGLGLDDFI